MRTPAATARAELRLAEAASLLFCCRRLYAKNKAANKSAPRIVPTMIPIIADLDKEPVTWASLESGVLVEVMGPSMVGDDLVTY